MQNVEFLGSLRPYLRALRRDHGEADVRVVEAEPYDLA